MPDKTDQLESLLAERILLLDGAPWALRSRINRSFDERAMRGERFAAHHKDLKNFADVLCLTHPAELTEIHRRYLAAGAGLSSRRTRLGASRGARRSSRTAR